MTKKPPVYNKERNNSGKQMAIQPQSYWQMNPQAVTILVSMWRTGYTAGQILQALGDPPGITRNAVIGKAHRMGLKQNKYVEPRTKPLPMPVEPPKTPPRPIYERRVLSPHQVLDDIKDLPPEESKHAVSLYDAEPDQCRWLIGKMTYCGAPKVKNSNFSFCEAHAKRGLTISYRSHDLGRFSNKRW